MLKAIDGAFKKHAMQGFRSPIRFTQRQTKLKQTLI